MKAKALAAAAALIGVGVVLAPILPSKLVPPCVARYPGEPETLCRRKVLGVARTVESLAPFSVSEAVGWCRPIACVRTVSESAERIPTGYNPYTGDIFSVADGGHE